MTLYCTYISMQVCEYSEVSLICHHSFSKIMVDYEFGGLTGYLLVLVRTLLLVLGNCGR